MKLFAKCSDCNSEIKIKTFLISNRIELAKSKGEEFEQRCTHCGHRNEIYVDEVIAEKNDSLIFIVGGISFLLAIALTYFFWHYGYIAAVSFAIPLLLSTTISQNQRNSVNLFNGMYFNSKKRLERLKSKSSVN
ncbi:hypothetical protein [Marinifilum caeruleilacunae]|uniref:Cxxc_20_cxxc protein n=1 Tax=Marinifilum caeruleilacunae TaxID=2499076 RepID=A0ABX1X0V6_9BACT|nr:hypothetical protein [Marinifilum caeruleilacunae]NOU62005.1 hypothetical protein [Marinifilum caeruleilacunae]